MKYTEEIIFSFLMVCLGFAMHMLYQEWNNERVLNGLYVWDINNYSNVETIAHSRDGKGDWVCVNVAYDMKPKEAYDTCVHECSHMSFSEIYAERCEDDPIKCMEFLDE